MVVALFISKKAHNVINTTLSLSRQGNSDEIFGVSGEAYTWAQPLPEDVFPEGLKLVNSLDANAPVPSCRNADGPYQPGVSFVLTVDGFITSDNVKVEACGVMDEGFAVSDHNPVKMTFELFTLS